MTGIDHRFLVCALDGRLADVSGEQVVIIRSAIEQGLDLGDAR